MIESKIDLEYKMKGNGKISNYKKDIVTKKKHDTRNKIKIYVQPKNISVLVKRNLLTRNKENKGKIKMWKN